MPEWKVKVIKSALDRQIAGEIDNKTKLQDAEQREW